MIVGGFDGRGSPYVECRVIIPRLQVDERVRFLLDTGADNTSLHPLAARRARIPFSQLGNRANSRGIGGMSSYFREPALLVFDDDAQSRIYSVELRIAEPNESNLGLPSLLWAKCHQPLVHPVRSGEFQARMRCPLCRFHAGRPVTNINESGEELCLVRASSHGHLETISKRIESAEIPPIYSRGHGFRLSPE